MGKPVWVRYTLVPGLTDDPANVEGVAKFVAPMKNVEWVEVLPFHQLGSFKWKALGMDYQLADTPPAPRNSSHGCSGNFATRVATHAKRKRSGGNSMEIDPESARRSSR